MREAASTPFPGGVPSGRGLQLDLQLPGESVIDPLVDHPFEEAVAPPRDVSESHAIKEKMRS